MDGWMDVVSFCFVGVKRMTMNEQSTFGPRKRSRGNFSLFNFFKLIVSHFTFLNVRS